MLTAEALVVCHVSVVDWLLRITPGLAVREAVGSGEVFTVTAALALACAAPPAPFAVRLYVTVEAGVTCCEPLAETVPIPSMLTVEAWVVCQVSVTIWPLSISAGTAVRDVVGGAGGAVGVAGRRVAVLASSPTGTQSDREQNDKRAPPP